MEVFPLTEPGVVFTKDWVVDFVLDIAGYTVNDDLLSGCVVEPSCGKGAFLCRIALRLCERAVQENALSVERLRPCVKALSCVTMGSDLYVGFFEKGLGALAEDEALCFICSDRWLQNRYGSRLRAFVSESYSLDVHVRMHDVDAFEDDVSAYPAISLIRRGAARPVHYMECRPRFSLSDVPGAESWIFSGEGAYQSESASADVLRPLTGSEPIALAAPEKLQLLGDLANRTLV